MLPDALADTLLSATTLRLPLLMTGTGGCGLATCRGWRQDMSHCVWGRGPTQHADCSLGQLRLGTEPGQSWGPRRL